MVRKLAVMMVFGLAAGLLSVASPAQAQAPVGLTVFEGVGNVCSAASQGGSCVYDLNDPAWAPHKLTNNPPGQGLYWPGVGPAGRGPFSFSAGRATSPPTGFCVSTEGGPGCLITSQGNLSRGGAAVALGNGAYCGSSKGEGTGVFSPAQGSGASGYSYTYGWEQSVATILPLVGETNAGQTIMGFTSSRGLSGAGNCGITDPTTGFQVEGMTVTF